MLTANWINRYMGLAKYISTWSKDPSTQVGAVIVRPNNTVVSHGFNGLPRGVRDLSSRLYDRPLKHQMIVHAELNAIINAGESVEGCSLFIYPFQPCSQCAGSIIQSGIKTIFFPSYQNERVKYSFELARTMFFEAGVELIVYDKV